MIEAVVFDLDGTLVNLPIEYELLFGEFKKIMKRSELRPLAETISMTDETTRDNVFKAWEKAELAVSGRISSNETGLGIYRMHKGKRKGLVTLQGRAIVKLILRDFDLDFDFIVTREDTLSRVDQILKAARKLGADKRNVLFVGNTEGDAAAARQVGCKFLRVK